MTVHPHTDDLQLLIDTLPEPLQLSVRPFTGEQLLEIVLDLGRPPQARLPGRAVNLVETPVTRADLERVIAAVGDFGSDNRAGIEGTLHRISAIRNRRGEIVGLTLRVGRALFGTIDLIRDLIEGGRSLLLLGRPGVGKTTKLREIARVLADDFQKRVIVIDTSNEIAGDGDIPHQAIGSARRMQVAYPEAQHAVMIEAVENHMPEVIIIDEIGSAAEALAARTIAERGVQLIGTAHGNSLENLVMNPILSDLVGGVHTVTLSDEEARRRRTTKTVNERKAPPTFEILIEMVDRNEVRVHKDTAQAVDALLRGFLPSCESRKLSENGAIEVTDRQQEPAPQAALPPVAQRNALADGPPRLYLHGVNRDLVERVIRDLGLKLQFTPKAERADLMLALRTRDHDSALKRLSRSTGASVHLLKRNTTSEIRRLLLRLFSAAPGVVDEQEIREAMQEARSAILQVNEGGLEVALPPRRAALRKAQHRLISSYGLESNSVGSEPMRHLVVHPSYANPERAR